MTNIKNPLKNSPEEENKKLRIENSLLNSGYFQLKETTEKLRESEEKFLKAFEISPYAIVITRVKDKKIINVNQAFTLISGFTKEEVLKNPNISLKIWGNLKDRKKVLSSLKNGLKIINQEYQFKIKNGKYVTGLFSARIIYINKELCIISSISDITERKELEKIILEKQEMFEKAEKIAISGSYVLDVKQKTWTRSKELDKIFGIDNNYERSISGWSKLVMPEDRKMMNDYFVSEVLKKHHSFNKEYRIIRKNDKAMRWVHGVGQLELNNRRQVIKMFGTIQDVTERKEFELKLDQKNRALKMISESNQSLIHASDEQKLLNKICQIIVKVGGYRLAWVGLVEYDKTKTIRPVAQAGYGSNYVKLAKLTWANTKRGRGPGGVAVRTGKPSLVKDILNNPSMIPWQKNAIKYGYKSTVFLPLFNNKQIFGVLGIYSSEINAFDSEELKILNEFTGDLSFGIKALRERAENIKAQKALIASENRYRNLFETARDGLIVLDSKTGKIREINYYLIELLGYGPDKFLQKKLWEINLFKSIVSSKKSFEILKNQKYKRFENVPLHTALGKLIYVEFISNIYPADKSGLIQCNIRDVTERHYLEEQIAQSEKKYSNLVENINDAVILIQDGIIKYANSAVRAIIDTPLSDIIGKPMINFISPEYQKLVAENYKQQLKEGNIKNRYELIIINKLGEKIPVETNNSVIMFEGRPANLSILRDISQAKKLDNIKSEFISIASHQLRSPLTGIKWFSQLLINQKIGHLSEKQVDFITQIYNSNERMIRLVNDLLDVSHLETGDKFKIDKKSGDIVALINNVIKDQKMDSPGKKITIKINKNCPSKLILRFDKDKIYQVFSNIINNSIKYSGKSSKIIIGLKCLANETLFSVKDFGLGIPDNQKERIFQKFFRADNIASVSTNGTGLGLYIVKGIIETHGGKIWFESKENEGTTFYFSLPLKNNK